MTACFVAQVFTQEARKDIAYYIMPRFTYPHGMLTEQVYSGDPELASHLEKLHLSPDNFKPAWIHANWRHGSSKFQICFLHDSIFLYRANIVAFFGRVGRVAKRLFLKDRSVWQVTRDQGFPNCSLVAGSMHASLQ